MALKVSIVMPLFNAEKHLIAAIDSVLFQTYPHFELIIINDCSTDQSVQIVESFKDARIRLQHNIVNLGAHATVNVGYRAARGDAVCQLDADDIFPIDSIEKRVSLLQESPVAIVHAGLTSFFPDGSSVYFPPVDANNLMQFRNFLAGKRDNLGINMNAMLFRTSCFEQIGYRMEESHRFNADYEYALRLLTSFPSLMLNENTYFYRFSDQSTLQKNKKKPHWEEHLKEIEQEYLEILSQM